MKTGDFLLLRGSGAAGAMVRHWTGSAWAHCGLVYMEADGPMLLDAHPQGGVRRTALERNLPALLVAVPEIMWTPEIQAFVRQHLGDGYSLDEAARGGLDLRGNNPKKWNCAEWAGAIYRRAGLPISEYAMNPQLVFNDLMKLGPRELRLLS